ncbi:hypothetical protein IPF37_05155 [bacterium]|nr:MAG: hypothetical protein IPF37_05155 [bacterium]
MISKISQLSALVFLLSGTCWAAADQPIKKPSEEDRKKLAKLAKEVNGSSTQTLEELLFSSSCLGQIDNLSFVLLKGYIGPDHTFEGGNFPFRNLVDSWHNDNKGMCAWALFVCGADPNRFYAPDMPLIFRAVQRCAFDIVIELLKAGADVTHIDAHDRSIFYWAEPENLSICDGRYVCREEYSQKLLALLEPYREMVLACHKAKKHDLDLSNLFEEEGVVYCTEEEAESMKRQSEDMQ